MTMTCVTDTNVMVTSGPSDVTIPPEIADRLEGFGELRAGWDGYHAVPPSDRAIRRALFVLGESGPALFDAECRVTVAPALDGGVDVEVVRGARSVSVVITNAGTVSVERSDGEDVENAALGELRRHLRWICRT